MTNWIEIFLKDNPEFAKKKIVSRGTHHIAFADGKKTIWCFASLPVNAVGADYLDSVNDGYIYGSSSDYAIARNTAYTYSISANSLIIGQVLSGSYFVFRSFLKFDTSAIPDSDNITQVNLKMVCTEDYSSTDFDVQIVKQDWSAQDPLSDANKEAAYDNCLAGTADDNIWRNTSGIVINTQYASGNLNTAWVNKTGWTYYSLRSSRDYAGTSPSGEERIFLASQDHATVAYRPVLTVESIPNTSQIENIQLAETIKFDISKKLKHSLKISETVGLSLFYFTTQSEFLKITAIPDFKITYGQTNAEIIKLSDSIDFKITYNRDYSGAIKIKDNISIYLMQKNKPLNYYEPKYLIDMALTNSTYHFSGEDIYITT